MLDQAMRVDATPAERTLLWMTAAEQVISPRTAGRYRPVDEFTPGECAALLEAFFERLRTSAAPTSRGFSEATGLDAPRARGA